MLGHTFTQPMSGFAQPFRAKLRRQLLLAPVRLFAVKELGQLDGGTEVHRYLAETLLQRTDDFEDVEDRLFLLGRSAQFAQISTAFQHALVADVHRNEHNRHPRVAQETAQGDGEHAGFGLQHSPGPRATAFDKVFDRETLDEQRVQVLGENRCIQRVTLECAAHEKRPATAQQAADDRHVQVDAGSDVRRREPVAKQQIGQQQVIDMAAVTRDVNDFMPWRHFLHAFDVADFDAVVNLVPEPAEDDFHEADNGIGIVRGDLVAVAQRPGPCLVLGDVLPFGFFDDRLLDQRLVQQPFDHGAPVRNVRADDRAFQVAKVHAQQTLGHAQGQFVTFVFTHQLAHVNGRGKLYTGLATQNQNADQAAQPAGHGPAVGEQQFPGAGLAVR
ncbi:Unknown protein sequence [Pseudomonas meliae]|uniref:Uncharacterized protein n=1 Tax=Pseudomonas meliae TaxID=86176 RepID=A0A0N8S674_9PSED|nr:Unknown protein sequence [Pseudomonas meliae]